MQQLKVGDPLILVIQNQYQQHGESNAKVGPGMPSALSQADELFLTLVRLRLDLKDDHS